MRRDLKDEILTVLKGDRLIDFVGSMGFQVRRAGTEHTMLCPFHDDSKPSLGINTRKNPNGIFKCFSCGWGGDAFKLVMDYHNLEFKDCLNFMAERLGIKTDGPSVKPGRGPIEKRVVQKPQPQIETMTPREVLDCYRHYKSLAVDPLPYCEQLLPIEPKLAARALDMLGGLVAPHVIFTTGDAIKTERMVLVVPQRLHDSVLTTLRYRFFDNKDRRTLDIKERIEGKLEQVKCSTAGLMALPEFFDETLCLDNTQQIVVEGETDLWSGTLMMLRAFGEDVAIWPARWCGLPGVNNCHDMLLRARMSENVITFTDSDEAGINAVFTHRRKKMIETDGKRRMVKDLDSTDMEPGLLQKIIDVRKQARAAFPPPHPREADKKYDLRDMVNDGLTWHGFFKHCLTTGCGDPLGRRRSILNLKGQPTSHGTETQRA